jgi:ATP-dependent Clp protease protease subunit
MDISVNSPQILEALLSRRHILIQNRIDAEVQVKVTRFLAYLNALDETPITVLIDSPGGDTRLSLFICDAIEHSKAEVRGLVVGDAISAAFRILQSCHRRQAYPHAVFMFHATSIEGRRIDSPTLMDDLKRLQSLQDEQMEVFSKRSKQTIEQCREWSRNEKTFKAQEALEAGFLDEILQSPQR